MLSNGRTNGSGHPFRQDGTYGAVNASLGLDEEGGM
jgi:hypothetical protein